VVCTYTVAPSDASATENSAVVTSSEPGVDGDGDLSTTGDQSPREGWSMHLVVNGVRQIPNQLTGEDGCTTWSDLVSGHTYSVEEDNPTDWTMFLLVDGTRQEPGQNTGQDGCTTWNNLATGYTYGVEEDSPAGWTPLTPISHSFGTILPGDSKIYTFINTEDTVLIYLPMVVRNPND